jgi:hypothetical protein
MPGPGATEPKPRSSVMTEPKAPAKPQSEPAAASGGAEAKGNSRNANKPSNETAERIIRAANNSPHVTQA